VSAAVKAVLPHPLDVLRLAAVPIVNVGRTRAMLSVVGSRGAFNSKVYEIEEWVHVAGSATVNALTVSAGATVAVDVVIFIALMSATFASFSVTAAVRPLQFAACVALLAVTPDAIVTVHSRYAFSVAVCAESVKVAVAVPVFELLVVNVVVPHPLAAADNEPPNLNVGSNRAIVSGVVVSKGEFKVNMYAIEDDPEVTGFVITSLFLWKADVGATTPVDVDMEPTDAVMSDAEARATATVRVFRLAV
jgi:hypothetical protein